MFCHLREMPKVLTQGPMLIVMKKPLAFMLMALHILDKCAEDFETGRVFGWLLLYNIKDNGVETCSRARVSSLGLMEGHMSDNFFKASSMVKGVWYGTPPRGC